MSTLTNERRGFTLIELLVVIAIIGMISSIATVALNGARQRSRDAKRVADVRSIQAALELYFADQNGYPQETGIALGDANNTSLCGTSGFGNACSGTVYMGFVPAGITPADGGCSTAANRFVYASSSPETYSLTFCLGAATGDLDGGGHIAGPGGIQ